MSKRATILTGMALGLIWSLAVMYIGNRVVVLPVFTVIPTIFTAFLAPGLVCLLMVGWIGQRRFFDDRISDGGALVGAALVDQKVLNNTVEQLVLALCLWPAAAIMMGGQGPGMIVTLSVAFAIARVLFWIGYHLSPPLRAFGFAATFYPTVVVSIWAVITAIGDWT